MTKGFFDDWRELEKLRDPGPPALSRAEGLPAPPAPGDTEEHPMPLYILNQLSNLFNYSTLDYRSILEQVLDVAVRSTQAQRGALLLFDNEHKLALKVTHQEGVTSLGGPEILLSMSVIEKVVETDQPIFVHDLSKDNRFSDASSVQALGLLSVMCAPLVLTLRHQGAPELEHRAVHQTTRKILGVIYVDSTSILPCFDEEKFTLFCTLANYATMALRNARLYYEATTDSLTGLFNRRHFETLLADEFLLARKHKTPLSLLMIDLDHFKKVNDTLGHLQGDDVLRRVAGEIRRSVRNTDISGRYGGEEFVVILPDTSLEGAEEVAKKILGQFEHFSCVPVLEKGPPGSARAEVPALSLSIGVAALEPEIEAPADLVKLADHALYLAKESGRGRVQCASREKRELWQRKDRLAGIVGGDPAHDYRNVSILLDTIASVNKTRDLNDLLDLLTDVLIEITQADRGLILLRDPDGRLGTRVARSRHRKPIDPLPTDLSGTLPARVIKTGEAICLPVLAGEDVDQLSSSVRAFQLASVICLPLRVGDRALGVVYLDSRSQNPDFQQSDLPFLEALSREVAMAIEHAQLMEEKRQAEEFRRRELQEENRKLRETLSHRRTIVGESEPMERVFDAVRKVAKSDATVLLCGESGTGKEAIARAIHELSTRRDHLHVIIDCGAIPETLIESELFGHEKGSFTGAISQKIGKFEHANGGTVFIDEVGDLPLQSQVKLLRVLQEREIERVGGTRSIRVDVRVIAATNRDLAGMVKQGLFREDLFYRLNVVVLTVPPLRERGRDILLLAGHFLERFMLQAGKPIRGFTSEAKAALTRHEWPGNVRELENKIEQAVILADGEWVDAEDLALPQADSATEAQTLADRERQLRVQSIQEALRKSQGNISEAAKELGIGRQKFYALMRRYGLQTSRDRKAGQAE